MAPVSTVKLCKGRSVNSWDQKPTRSLTAIMFDGTLRYEAPYTNLFPGHSRLPCICYSTIYACQFGPCWCLKLLLMLIYYQDQLDDLQGLSEAYESENRQMKKRGYPGNPTKGSLISSTPNDGVGVPYENSEVSRRQDANLRHSDSADMMDDVYYPPQPQYTTASTQQGYPALTSSYPQPSGGLYAGSAYSTDPNYPVGSSYTTPYPSGSARPSDNYTYGNESPRNDPYRQPPGYAAAQRPNPGRPQDSRDPRQDPRLEARYPPSREPARMDPRAMQQQPQGYGYSSGQDIGGSYAYAPPQPLPGRGMEPYPPRGPPVYDHPYRNEPVRDVRPEMRDDGRRRR